MQTPEFSPASITITGDDFGRSEAVNDAIEQYHRAGALHQASLMVNESAVAHAIEIARRNPTLRVGLHLTLCDGRASEPDSLIAPDGQLPPSPAVAGLRYAFDPRLRAALEGEIRCQFEKFRALGLPATYWDGHTHLHLHPTVMRLTVPIAQQFGFKATRLVREPGPPGILPWIFHRLSVAAIPALRAAGIDFADAVFGLRATARMTPDAFRTALQRAHGHSEIYFHPAAENGAPSPNELRNLLAEFPYREAFRVC